MITQIEIDGFKTFKNFKIELAPFQVIVGANGSGKSNLFDALQLLGRLAAYDLLEAFQGLRGEANDLFTKDVAGATAQSMRFAIEMLLDHEVKNDIGRTVRLEYTRLRYELEISAGLNSLDLEQLYIKNETLKAIPSTNDTWVKKYKVLSAWLPGSQTNDEAKFIETGEQHKDIQGNDYLPMGEPIITVFREDQFQGNPLQYRSRDLNGTILNLVRGAEYLPISAAREELLLWKFVHLDPEELRKFSSTKSPRTLSSRGSNLASTLAWLQAEDKLALGDVSRDMANLVPGMLKIRVERDTLGDRYVIYAETADKRVFPSQVLSDGTLRLLALATLKNDPRRRGILCLEEPENGVSPLHLENMARLLRQMATDLSDPDRQNKTLCQVLVTTHSPLFISQPTVIDSVLLAMVPTRVQGKANPVRVTIMAPVMTSEALLHLEGTSRDDNALGAYTANVLKSYLDSELLEEAREQLENFAEQTIQVSTRKKSQQTRKWNVFHVSELASRERILEKG